MKTLLKYLIYFLPYFIISCKDVPLESTYEDADIKEAVFRYQIAVNGSGYEADTLSIFLSFAVMDTSRFHFPIMDSDPDDRFMKRFIDDAACVKKYSQCEIVQGSGVFDKETGKRGILFRVGQITWTSDKYVIVEGGYYAGGRNAEGDIFYLHKSNGRWWVYGVMDIWVS